MQFEGAVIQSAPSRRCIEVSLPIKTTADDVRTVVSYLKNKPTGATIDEAKAAIGSTHLDGRKMKAYEDWRLVARDGDRLKLHDLGWELARQPASEKDVFRTILRSLPAYSSVLEWAHHQSGVIELTTNDVAAHWHEHHRDAVRLSAHLQDRQQHLLFELTQPVSTHPDPLRLAMRDPH